MKSAHRQLGFVSTLLGVTLAFATPAAAQRSGFIIGFGLGPGYYSVSPEGGSSDGKAGLGADFHIGGAFGSGIELYLFEKFVTSGSDVGGIDTQSTGVVGVGMAVPVSDRFYVHGGVGTGIWAESASASAGSVSVSAFSVEESGLGLVGGGRYELSESGRWMLNFDVVYEEEPISGSGASVLAFQVTINIMSH